MPTIIPVGFAQANVIYSLAGDDEPIVNTFGVKLAGSDYEETANVIHAAWRDEIMDLISNMYTLVGVTLYVGQDGGPPAVFESDLPSAAGGVTLSPLPQNCAALIRKRTGTTGRRGRGRLYLPGVWEGNVDHAGQMLSAGVTAYNDATNLFLQAVTAEPAVDGMYILHRSEGEGVEPPPTQVTSLQCDTRIATQRRRLRK